MFASRSFFGIGGVINPLATIDAGSAVYQPSTATASITFLATGAITWSNYGATSSGQWFDPVQTGIGGTYWVRLTVNSGSAPTTGSAGVWIALAADVLWRWSRSAAGTTSSAFTIQIATDSAGTNIVATGTGTATAFVDVP